LTVIKILAIINWYSKIAVSNIVYLLTSILLPLMSTFTQFSLYQLISSEDRVLIKVLCQEKGYGGHFEHHL